MNNIIDSNTSYNAGYQRNVGSTNNNSSVHSVKPVFTSTQKPKADLLELSTAYINYAASSVKSFIANLNVKNLPSQINAKINKLVGREDTNIANLSARQKMGIEIYMKNAGYFTE